MAPTISVIMPVYNAERYVAEAVESILAQTFTDFEFLIIDDGSTDGSLEILERYAAQDSRIRLKSRPNTGLVVALNEMLADARGEFIARMDADDVSMPERFAMQLNAMAQDCTLSLVGAQVEIIDPLGRHLRTAIVPTNHKELEASLLNRDGQMIYHPVVMFRKSAIAGLGGYSEEHFPAEDLYLFLKLALNSRIENLPCTLLRYREHSSKVGFKFRERQCEAVDSILSAARKERCMPELAPRAVIAPVGPGDTELKWAWWALASGEIATARSHAVSAVLKAPKQLRRWKALACAIRGY